MKRFASDDAKQAFTAAIKSIEACSSAEVVIAVRHHSGTYLHADLIVGAIGAFATLAFTLFSSFEFSLLSILLDPLIAGVALGLINTQLPWLRRALTLPTRRRQRVVTAARAAFYEKGIRLTSDRTGMLVYMSLLEKAVEIVGDVGVTDAVPARSWEEATAAMERTLAETLDGVAVAKKIEALGPICEPVLIRGEDDVNELPDEVCAP